MRVMLGDIIVSEFGKGKITAITAQWIVHETDDKGNEAALYIKNQEFWVPAEPGEHGTKHSFIKLLTVLI